MVRPRNLNSALDVRRIEVDRVANAGPQWFHLTAEVDVFGSGAATTSLLFPVTFVNKPRFSFGSELAPGDPYTVGNMPTCVVTVLDWDTRSRVDGSVIYAGCTVCVVTTGPTDQNMIAFVHMEGDGLRGPSQP